MNKKSQENKNLSVGSSIITIALVGGFIWFLFGGGMDKMGQRELQRIENQVAADAVKQYHIAKRNGNAVDICVQARLVTASYLQANDEFNYAQWKVTETNDCARAGIGR